MHYLTLLWIVYVIFTVTAISLLCKYTIKFEYEYLVTYDFKNENIHGIGNCNVTIHGEKINFKNLDGLKEKLSEEISEQYGNASIVILNIVRL